MKNPKNDSRDAENNAADSKQIVDIFRLEHGEDDGTCEQITDAFLGCWESPEEWAEEYLSDCGFFNKVPLELIQYIDFKKYARDREIDGMSFIRHQGLFWVYSSIY
jgi:antirestriction protein